MSSMIARMRGAALIGALVLTFLGRADAQGLTPDAARRFVESVGNQAVDVVASPRRAVDRRAAFARIMLASLDFNAIGTVALGRLARKAAAEQRREFMPLFAAYAIDVAVAKFGNLQRLRFGLGRATRQPDGDVKVHTRVETGDRPMEILWRVRNTAGRPRITDIEVDGASLAIYYRGEIDRADVDDVPQLIARLRDMTWNSSTVTITQQAMR